MSARHRLRLALPLGGLALALLAALTMAGADGAHGASVPPAVVPVCPPTIGFGETIECSIASGAETHVYTFVADASDKVLARMAVSSGTLDPQIEIRKDGTLLCSAYYPFEGAAEIDACDLPTGGTHTVLVGDYGATETGDYFLHLQRLNNPGNASALSFGETTSGTIGDPTHMNAYTFDADAGDKVLARMATSSGELDPEVRLYGPDGTLLCSDYYPFGGAAEIPTCDLPTSGPHTVLVGDYGATETGDYFLHLQRLNNPGNAAAISCGETKSDTIGDPAHMNAYTFVGDAGDSVRVTMSVTSGELDPEVRLYGPDGTLLCSDYYPFGGAAEIDACDLVPGGTHTILASDYGATETGDYDLYLACLTPGAAAQVAQGEEPTHEYSNRR